MNKALIIAALAAVSTQLSFLISCSTIRFQLKVLAITPRNVSKAPKTTWRESTDRASSVFSTKRVN